MKSAAAGRGVMGTHQLAYDETNAAIAHRVKVLRTSLGVSLPALSAASGVDLTTLSDLEDGGQGCSAADLWRIAQALRAPLSDLCRPTRQGRPSLVTRTFRPAQAAAAARPARH